MQAALVAHLSQAQLSSCPRLSGRHVVPKAARGAPARAQSCSSPPDSGSCGPQPSRRSLAAAAAALLSLQAQAVQAEALQLSDEEWGRRLSKAQFRVLRKQGTELPFTSKLNSEKRQGLYRCAGCGAPVFSSKTKFDSGTGWPSFFDPLPGAVAFVADRSIPFYERTEEHCSRCGGHLGHVFPDGPPPTGDRHCLNGVALTFSPGSPEA